VNRKSTILIESLLLFGLFLVAVAVTPWHNLEPSVLPKFTVLTITVGAVGLINMLMGECRITDLNLFSISIFGSIFLSVINIAVNHEFISERLFGIHGRNFGALSFISITLLVLISFTTSHHIRPLRILLTIKLASLVVTSYFVFQLMGLDRSKWIDAYNGIPSSTLGNPNFVSAFVAISFVSSFPLLFAGYIAMKARVATLILSLLELYVLFKSDSLQGLIIAFVGIFVFSIAQLKANLSSLKSKKNIIFWYLFTLLSIVFFTTRNTEFLSIDKSTFGARLNHWQVGIGMGLDSPFMGKGFDSIGEFYYRFRENSTFPFSNSAHNYLVDLFAFGGFPLVFIASLPLVLVFRYVLRQILVSKEFFSEDQNLNLVQLGLHLSWIGFLIQAMLNPFNIALAYLGYFLTGYLYGISKTTKEKSESTSTERRETVLAARKNKRNIGSFFGKLSLAFIFLFIPILGCQSIIADAKFRDAIEQGSGDAIYRLALSQPRSFQRMHYASEIFLANNLNNLAASIINEMVEQNPDNIRGWLLLEKVSKSEISLAKIRAKLQILDPKNPAYEKP